MWKIFFKQVSDLNGESIMNDKSLSQLKKATEILIVDDDAFTYLDALKKHEYNIEYKSDLESLKDVEAYDIILCDIRGVGKFLQSDYEGAYLAKQIKEKYPNKIVISYTANDYDPKFQEYLNYSDSIIAKGTSLEDWSALLDAKIKECVDPVKQWENLRNMLLKEGVSTIKVAQIESKYVGAVKNKNFESIKKMYEKNTSKEAEIMLSLLTSAIAKLFNLGGK